MSTNKCVGIWALLKSDLRTLPLLHVVFSSSPLNGLTGADSSMASERATVLKRLLDGDRRVAIWADDVSLA